MVAVVAVVVVVVVVVVVAGVVVVGTNKNCNPVTPHLLSFSLQGGRNKFWDPVVVF